MGKGIILRVKDGTKLSPEILKAVGDLLPNYQLEYYAEKPNYRLSLARRADTLYQAFLFALDAYPPDPKFTYLSVETLKGYAEQSRKSCVFIGSSVSEMHLELEKFTANLVEALSLCRDWKNKAIKEATAILNEAEQYMLMNRGRLDLATLTPINLGKGKKIEYVLQWDESLPPYYDELLNEVQEIKSQQYPKTNALFRTNNELQDYQKAYFFNLGELNWSYKDVALNLKAFISEWNTNKQKAQDLERIRSNTLPLPAWFNDLNAPLRAMVKALTGEYVATINEKLKEFYTKAVEESQKSPNRQVLPTIVNIPEWYWALPDRQQYFLEHVLKNTPSLETALSFISSRHRTIPLPANYAKHRLYHIDSKGQVQLIGSERFRSSHVASRDILNCSKEIQLHHCSSNYAKVTEFAKAEQPILFQTLISPVSLTKLAKYFIEIPDLELYEKGQEGVGKSRASKVTLHTNHPYNMAKYVIYTEATNQSCLALINYAKQYLSNHPNEDLAELLADYHKVLNSPTFTATLCDFKGRELFLSSLEQLIIMHIEGYSYGSCVSGKDRKAIELIHTDAMMLYKKEYGKFPKFGAPEDNEERIDFVNIVVDLYISRHQHEHAGQNAPGSEGIKTPSNYFPQDIADAINKRMGSSDSLKNDDRLATDNEVKNISKKLTSFMLEKNVLLSQLMAKQIGEKKCRELYDALFKLIEEKSLFTSVSTGFFGSSKLKISAGIESIATMMQDDRAGDSVVRIAKAFRIILDRPGTEFDNYQGRTNATKSVYNCSRNILVPPTQKSLLKIELEKTLSEWEDLFSKSKNSKECTDYKSTATI